MEKTLKELQFIMEARKKIGPKLLNKPKILSVGLSARRNLCIHPFVSTLSKLINYKKLYYIIFSFRGTRKSRCRM